MKAIVLLQAPLQSLLTKTEQTLAFGSERKKELIFANFLNKIKLISIVYTCF